MIDLRDLLLFSHILGAVGWIGVTTFAYFYLGQAAKAGGEEGCTASDPAVRLIGAVD